MRSVTYTLAVVGAFERRTENDTTTPRAIRTAPMAFMIIPSCVHSEYLELNETYGDFLLLYYYCVTVSHSNTIECFKNVK